ncbi:MAG: DUF1295 domain-containing protein [Verrucomicrobiota bacterium]
MNSATRTAILGTTIAVSIGVVLILALGRDSETAASRNIIAAVIGLAFGIQWMAFIPAWFKQTEHFYDLVGGSSFMAVTAFCLALGPSVDFRSITLFAMVVLWGGRLSFFLFRRVRRSGKDQRFDEIKKSFPRFLFAWTAQGLWVAFALAPVIVALLQPTGSVDGFLFAGAAIWFFGYGFETIADMQKTRFKKDPENEGRFIATGLWAHSRHPNYFGEITLWVGIAIIASPTLVGWQFLALASPLFKFALLNYVSGVPMLEKRADAKWGHLEAYQAYKDSTPSLFPRLRRSR